MVKRIDVKEIFENGETVYEIKKMYFQNLSFGKDNLSEEEKLLVKYSKCKDGDKLSKEDITSLRSIEGFTINYSY